MIAGAGKMLGMGISFTTRVGVVAALAIAEAVTCSKQP
jgi:hypothetical protein